MMSFQWWQKLSEGIHMGVQIFFFMQMGILRPFYQMAV